MKTHKTAPGARRLIESLREMGYSPSTAVADLVDNSVSAGATAIYIDIKAQQGAASPHICISDNGSGMTRTELLEAMRFGAFQEYDSKALGKYGLGLKTASLSQCRTLTVASKPKGKSAKITMMRWDLDHVVATDDWNLIEMSLNDLTAWEKEILNSSRIQSGGTIVLWTGLEEGHPLLCAEDVKHRAKFQESLTMEVSAHLRMVFHRFIAGSGSVQRKTKIHVGGMFLEPWDPFCRAERQTKKLPILKLAAKVRNDRSSKRQKRESRAVTITPYVLPREDQFSDMVAWKQASGISGWNQQQGFYFYRNDRLLKSGGWSNLRGMDEHTKLLRVAVELPSELDAAFGINITKMRANLPAEIREDLRIELTDWIRVARDRYSATSSSTGNSKGRQVSGSAGDSRKIPNGSTYNVGPISLAFSNVPTSALTVIRGAKPGQFKVVIPQRHDCANLLDGAPDKDQENDALKRLCVTLYGLLEVVSQKRLNPSDLPIELLRRELRRELQ